MSIKGNLKKLFSDIKSWGWYEWVKYLLASFFIGFVVVFTVFALYMVITEADFTFDYTVILGVIVFGLYGALLFSPFLSIAYLIIKDYRLPHIILIVLNGIGVYLSVAKNMWDWVSVVNIVLIIMSTLCIYKITAKKKPKSKAETEDGLSIASLAVILFWIIYLPFMIMLAIQFPDSDFELETEAKCIETKIAKGYPEDFANKYCKDISSGCLRGRVYEENCDPEVKCCFATIEEDKKWNYLDYDENGNKVEK